jgi:hypothetical protein
MTAISAIIVNWNTRALLKKCLDAIIVSSQGLDVDVWVVDNGSQDGSPAMVKADYPQVHLIENQANVGFARANNQAARECQGEYLLLLNSDAFVYPNTLRCMLKVMADFPQAGAVGCQLLNEDLSLQRSCYSFPTLATELWQTLWLDRLFPKSKLFGEYLMTYWQMDDPREVDVVMGACMLVRCSALGEAELFDETFFMYSEEVDLCYRLKHSGWKVRYAPDAKAVHLWGGSARLVKVETLIRLYRSRVQFFRKHYGRLPAAIYKGLLYINSFSRSISGRLIYFVSRNSELSAKADGYWQLFRTAHAF